MKLTQKQNEALDLICDPRYKHVLLYGGAQSAKTYVCLYAVLIRALACPNSVHVICRLRLVDLRSAILLIKFPEVVRHRFGDDNNICRYVFSYPSYVELPNNSKIFFLGLEDHRGFEKILSPSYSTVMVDEASEIPYAAFTKLQTRLSQKNELKKISILTLNPTGKRHWTFKLFFGGKNPVDDTSFDSISSYGKLQMNPVDNIDNLPPDYIAMLESLPSQDRERFLYGHYSDDLDNVVFGQQIRDAESTGRFDDNLLPATDLPLYAVFDIGMNDATSVWFVQFSKSKIILTAYNEWTSTSIIDIIKSFEYKISGVYLPHDANHRWVGDGRSVRQMVEMFVNYQPDDKKFFVRVLKKFDAKWQQINMTRVFFKKLYFNAKNCFAGIEALKNYKYEKNETLGIFKNQPKHDWSSHAADALMYVVQAYKYVQNFKEEPERDRSKIYFDDIIKNRKEY